MTHKDQSDAARTKESHPAAQENPQLDDKETMTKLEETAEDWNLVLIATCAVPRNLLAPLHQAVLACHGWVLMQGEVSPRCADIDFEFPRAHSVEVYALLVAMGVNLSTEAHQQLTALCQCTRHGGTAAQTAVARVNLTLYAADGAEAYLQTEPSGLKEAA